jgi:hypothetical protein
MKKIFEKRNPKELGAKGLDVDKALEAILLGFGRKVLKLAFELAASRKIHPDLVQAERFSKTLERTKSLLKTVIRNRDEFKNCEIKQK